MQFKDKFWLTLWTLVSMAIFYVWGFHQLQLHQRKQLQYWDSSGLVTFDEVRPHLICRCQQSGKVSQSILNFCNETKDGHYLQPAEFEQKLQQQHQKLVDEIDELESRPIPKECLPGLKDLKAAFRPNEESLAYAEVGYYCTEKTEKVRYFSRAYEKAAEARRLSVMGSRKIEAAVEQNRFNPHKMATNFTEQTMSANWQSPRNRHLSFSSLSNWLFGKPRV